MLGAFAREYLAGRETRAAATRRADRLAIGKMIDRFGPRRDIRTITVRELEAFRSRLLRSASPVSVNLWFRHLRAFFSTAVRYELLPKSPFDRIRSEPEPEREYGLVAGEALARLLACAGARERRAVLFLLLTGLRPFEAVKATYGDIREGFLRVVGKRGKCRRVPITAECAQVLGTGAPDEFLLPWRCATTLSRVFKGLVRRAGLPESFRLYDCRHTAGTAFTMAGVDTTTAMRILGHSTVKAHERYIHVSAEHLEKAMLRVREIYGLGACRGGEPHPDRG
ncbi:MAG: site-specific integrase [Deltaproteobacteria bacterium]|nr:site-specific integrase [Deltaproteobacteria bacterium]